MSQVKIFIDRDTCVGCGAAPAACPEIFELGSDNGKNSIVEVYRVEHDDHKSVGIVPLELLRCVESGARVCPVGAIRYEIVD